MITHASASGASPQAPLEKVWEFEAADGIEPWMGPVAAYGLVFFGSKDAHVYALEAMTGQEKWKFKMGKRPRAPLVIVNEIVYVLSDDKNIYAIDARTGERRWQFSTGKDLYRPVVANGIAYVLTKDKNLYALDAQTGVERWRFSTGKDISLLGVGENMVFFGSEEQRVYGLDAISGAKRWEFKSGHKKHGPIAIGKGKVLISGDDDLYAININDGALSWVAKKANYGVHTPIVEGDLVLCTKELTILNLADGKIVAKLAPGQTVSNITVRDGTLYASIGGTIFANDLHSKQLNWYAVIEPQTALHIPWTLGEDSVFIGGYSNLYAINTSRLMKRWESPGLSRGIFDGLSTPVITDEMVIISHGKKVSAFKSSKDPASQRLLEIGDEIASSPKYTAVVLFTKEGFLGSKGAAFWPNCCCLCCGPVEKHADIMKEMDRVRLSVPGIPYCATCYQKTTPKGIFRKEKGNPGVEIVRTSPPTFAFRNEKYWAMFMEANRIR
jgi:outer membrane protein assembly factor BamB